MASIRELNFKVVLDDSKFKQQISADLNQARDLNKQMTELLKLKKLVDKETTASLVNRQKVRQEEERTKKAVIQTQKEQEKLNGVIKKNEAAQNERREKEQAVATRKRSSSSAVI